MKERDKTKPPITVFGAGIAGLTAAHELAVRGFQVQVIEPEYNEEFDEKTLDRGIGGMARSQWAVDPNDGMTGSNLRRLWPGAELLVDVALRFKDGKPENPARAAAVLDRLVDAFGELAAAGKPETVIGIMIEGLASPDKLSTDSRVQYLRAELDKRSVEKAVVDQLFKARMDGDPDRISFFIKSGTVVPAEHGFRFFPSFYRHLFDTMRRTPVDAPNEFQRTKATTFDNLVPAQGLGFARDGKAVSFMIPRHRMSFEETRTILEQVLGELGYTAADIARFSLAIFKYMTSSSARRAAEYEDTSWGDFVQSWRYSDISRQHIEYGPQMSAALRGSASDARTQGNITIQLLMDQLKVDALADYTLGGPTSSYWLNHWYDFLWRQNVTFARGKLTGFRVEGKEILPEVDGADVTGEVFVLALSLPAMVDAAQSFIAAAQGANLTQGYDDMSKVVEFAGEMKTLGTPAPNGPLQHLSGIQFYFEQELRFWRGHTQYLDSKWGLTSIAQPQFWARPRTLDDRYRSILSVDIGIFDRVYQPKNGGPAKRVWDCTPDEIAALAWEQIEDHHDDAFRKRYGAAATIPRPSAYALDATLSFQRGQLVRNGSMFLVNRTGVYSTRPGCLETAPGRSKLISRYEVMLGKYVLAGTFMQTFTRLTSMEGANESARHAVNALLQMLDVPGDRCEIWDPEDNELDDLLWFKELDQELLERGLPHFADVLGWDELPDRLELVRAMAATTRARRPTQEGVGK